MRFPCQHYVFLTLLACLLLTGIAVHAQQIVAPAQNTDARQTLIGHAIEDTMSQRTNVRNGLLKTALHPEAPEDTQPTVEDTVPITEDTIASDAATTIPSADDPYATREEQIRSTQRELYDSVMPEDDAREGIDYATIWSRQLPANAAQSLRSKKEFNYETTPKPPPRFLVVLLGILSRIFTPVLIVLLAATLIFAILYILRNNDIKLFARKQKPMALPDVEEKMVEDIQNANFQLLLEQAIHAANWTAGVRYLYLYTLQQLQRKGLIHLGPNKTNRDYLRDLTNTRWHNNFSVLTLDYEYVCYGNFPLSQQDFELIRQQFNTFKNELGPS
ncbi:protein of unknown function [Chitinophaga costaii]|uniref:Protein-glutamine gamma-glutamyltransferase-like C-terminal domain-containing protein n=1 Tax=Chitinophaga costaii TaxID=1335309 RepID=A0A1C4G155_9BACT|nr:DUF4129 domain-containing protein [Chitinophaga costaii]SCC61876.1 protein of unknown function [Chitinophaga costaii]